VYRNLWTPEEPQTATVASSASAMPSISNTSAAAAPVLGQSPHSPLDIRANTYWYACNLAARSYVYVWWFMLHRWLSMFWELFEVGIIGEVVLSLLFTLVAFFAYGFVRAILDWNVALDDPQQVTFGAPNVLSILHPNSAPAPAALNPPAPRPAARLSLHANAPRVVGNSSLKIYHLPACVWVKKISPQHSLQFASPSLADAEGYRPCKVCAP
jgi:hypothetical protein